MECDRWGTHYFHVVGTGQKVGFFIKKDKRKRRRVKVEK
jgi:hypothetical protein